MTWFLVDDRLHAHPKALATSLAALGLWTVAGSWSNDHLTDGFVPDHVLPLLCRGSNELADELVAAGLWRRVRGGYQFHQWEADGDGSRRNRTRAEVQDLRQKRADAGRKGGVASGNTRSKPGSKRSSKREAKTKPADQYLSLTEDLKGGPTTHDPPAPDAPPPRRCPQHAYVTGTVPACGACADARRAHDAWQARQPPPAPATTSDGTPWQPGTGAMTGPAPLPDPSPPPAGIRDALHHRGDP